MNGKQKRTIESQEDLGLLVREFYGRVRQDHLIGPIFEKAIGSHWDEHLKKIENFWATLLLGTESYHGRPFPPHLPLGLEVSHFEKWLELFFRTTDDLFEGQKADEIKMRALNIGRNFLANIRHFEKQKQNSGNEGS